MYEDQCYHLFLVRLRQAAWKEGNPIEWLRLLLHPYRTFIFVVGIFLTITIYEAPSGIFLMAMAVWVQNRWNRVSFWLAVAFLPIAIIWTVLLATTVLGTLV